MMETALDVVSIPTFTCDTHWMLPLLLQLQVGTPWLVFQRWLRTCSSNALPYISLLFHSYLTHVSWHSEWVWKVPARACLRLIPDNITCTPVSWSLIAPFTCIYSYIRAHVFESFQCVQRLSYLNMSQPYSFFQDVFATKLGVLLWLTWPSVRYYLTSGRSCLALTQVLSSC